MKQNNIKEYSKAWDCMTMAKKVNFIPELNTINLIPNHITTSSISTFLFQCIFLRQKDSRNNKEK